MTSKYDEMTRPNPGPAPEDGAEWVEAKKSSYGTTVPGHWKTKSSFWIDVERPSNRETMDAVLSAMRAEGKDVHERKAVPLNFREHPDPAQYVEWSKHCDPDALHWLALNELTFPYVLKLIAKRPETHEYTRALIARNEIADVRRHARMGLAAYSTDTELLDDLSNDDDSQVRENVARNPHTDPETLWTLTMDPYESVWSAAMNALPEGHKGPYEGMSRYDHLGIDVEGLDKRSYAESLKKPNVIAKDELLTSDTVKCAHVILNLEDSMTKTRRVGRLYSVDAYQTHGVMVDRDKLPNGWQTVTVNRDSEYVKKDGYGDEYITREDVYSILDRNDDYLVFNGFTYPEDHEPASLPVEVFVR